MKWGYQENSIFFEIFKVKLYFFLFETEFYKKKYSLKAYFDDVAKKLRKLKGGQLLDL